MKIHSDSYNPQDQTARLAAFDFEIRHRLGKQHTNVDNMSRRPLLKSAQCDIHHQGTYETKWGKKVDLFMSLVLIQKLQSKKERIRANQTLFPSIQLEGGQKELDELAQNNSKECPGGSSEQGQSNDRGRKVLRREPDLHG